jgi:hypothetical protein
MNYYIYKNSIEAMDRDLSLTNSSDISTDFNDLINNKFIQLNEEQIAFYLANPLLTVREIYLCRADIVIEPTLDELKTIKRTQIEQAYTKMASDNLDVQLPPLVWDGFKLGMPKCSATVSWLMQMEVERSGKIDSVLAAVDKAELELILNDPSQPVKPFLAKELFDEYING